MKENTKKELQAGIVLLAAFALWTVLIRHIDVQNAGPNGTEIGFATVNVWFHRLTGVHLLVYTITDWLGLIPIIICMGFGVLGLVQLIKRRSLRMVDSDILLLGAYYVLVILCYLLFEMVPINYRPILIDGNLEASYPSSTTLLVLSVMPSLKYQIDKSNRGICNRILGIYGCRKADCRRSLDNGYHRLRFLKFWFVYDLSVHGRIYRSKENAPEGGGIKWSLVKSFRNYEKAGR